MYAGAATEYPSVNGTTTSMSADKLTVTVPPEPSGPNASTVTRPTLSAAAGKVQVTVPPASGGRWVFVVTVSPTNP